MIELKCPEPLPPHRIDGAVPQSVFLAGSIEQGKAEDWQAKVSKAFSQTEGFIFNPRREYWDDGWQQNITDPNFYEQASWEMTAMDNAQVIAMYLDPKTKSPISLLELGMYCRSGKMIVCCPEGFWRKGNVDVVCERYNITNTDNMKDFIGKIHAKLKF